MSKTANNTLIGAFVVGALALIFLAIAIFGSGKLFKKTYEFVLFFDTSVSGLTTGSPVVLQGVPIGRVTSIRLAGDAVDMRYRIPVFIELDRQKLGTPLVGGNEKQALDTLVSKGFRGRLAQQSLLTGQLMIELNLYPPRERGQEITEVSYYENIPVIPTVSSPFDTIVHQMTHVPVDQIAQNILDITERLKELLSREATNTLPERFNDTLVQAKSAFMAVEDLSNRSTRVVEHIDVQLTDALNQLNEAFKQLNMTVGDMREVINPTSLQMLELNRSLRDVSDAARAVRVLADTLNRHPEALLQGKGVSE